MPPPGGYRDPDCRIKRQAQRYRVFEYDSGGVLVPGDVKAANAVVSWTVTISGVTETITGPNQVATLHGATHPVAEIRTDPGWAALLVFAGTVWFFFGVSKRGREQERQALVRWRERARRELGMNVFGVGGPPGPGKILVQGLIAQA